MSESNEVTEIDNTTSAADDTEQSEKTEKKNKTASSGKGIAVFSLLLTLLLAGSVAAAAYWLWPQWQALQQQQSELTQLRQDLTEQLGSISGQQQQLRQQLQTEQQTQLRNLNQQVNQQQQQLADQLAIQMQTLRQQVLQQDSAPPRHWRLAETQYLLQLANQKLLLEQDVASTGLLLKHADEKLAELDDSSLAQVRQAITRDRQYLSGLAKPDLTNLYLQLNQLKQLGNILPLKQQEQQLALVAEKADTSLQNWRSTLSYYWHNTWSKLIQVRSAVPEDYYSLTAEQQLMVRISLEQQLLLAEIAALQGKQDIYGDAINTAKEQLTRYFETEDEQVKAAAQLLQQLSEQKVALTTETLQSPLQLELYLQSLQEAGL